MYLFVVKKATLTLRVGCLNNGQMNRILNGGAENIVYTLLHGCHSRSHTEVRAMRLIDADALKRHGKRGGLVHWKDIEETPTIVEFEGDINKVIVKGEEYHKQLTTTWLGNFCPYRCEHCGRYVDSKERYCPNCGRKAVNYE